MLNETKSLSPDCNENPFAPGFGAKNCNGKREIAPNLNTSLRMTINNYLFLHSIKLNHDTESKKIYDYSGIALYERTDSHWPFGGGLRAFGHLFQIFKIARKGRFVCVRKR